MKQTNLQDNLRRKFTKQGVKMLDPGTVFFSKDTKIGERATPAPQVDLPLAGRAVVAVSIGGGGIRRGPALVVEHLLQGLVATVGGGAGGQIEEVVHIPGRLIHGLLPQGLPILGA